MVIEISAAQDFDIGNPFTEPAFGPGSITPGLEPGPEPGTNMNALPDYCHGKIEFPAEVLERLDVNSRHLRVECLSFSLKFDLENEIAVRPWTFADRIGKLQLGISRQPAQRKPISSSRRGRANGYEL